MSEPTLQWIEATTLDDLWEGEMLTLNVKGEQILLVHLPEKTFHAYQGVCPHLQASLGDGELEGHILTCNSHSWTFDVTTGSGINPQQCQLYRYAIKIEGDSLYVGIPQDRQQHYNRCREI